jgi:hypothetical protein
MGTIGSTWVLEVGSYIDDVDNNITELDIICNSPYITVVGTVLIFQYPSDITQDSVQIIVRDPGSANATTEFNVTLTSAVMPKSQETDFFQYLWILILIIAVLVSMLFLYVYHKGKYIVEEALLVYGKSGLLISHKFKGDEVNVDRDLMASMFTAIQDFVTDVFESSNKFGSRLKVMELGDRKVMIERGKYTYLAVVFQGGTWRLAPKLKETVTELETQFADLLEDWEGDMDSLDEVNRYIEALIHEK